MPNFTPGTVTVGLATTDTPQCWEFEQSLESMMTWSAYNGGPINRSARRLQVIGGPSLAGKRNKVCKTFLERTDSEWLLFIDDDQQFMPDLAQKMVDSADPVERPILSALIMAERSSSRFPIGPACTVWHEEMQSFVIPPYIPQERWWQVATIGTGCVLIHRTVLEKMREAHKDDAFPWFKHAQHPNQDTGEPDEMSEDYVFSLRASALDYPLYVDTTIEVGHVKRRVLTSHDFYAQPNVAPPPPRTVAVIPVKGNLRYTKDLVQQLEADPGCDEVVIIENGSPPDMQKWLKSCGHVVLDAIGSGIHQMWNMGAAYALNRPGPVNLLFLNNDIRIGEPFCEPLAKALRPEGLSDEQLEQAARLVAVCPNYDGRSGEGIEQLRGVCGERYDGTGGLSGFAFMVKGELFTHMGYRFPEECMWWYGDTDMVMTIDTSGGWYGMVHGVTVEHLDGGGRTGNWSDPEMQRQLAADQAHWQAKWSQVMESA